MRGPALAPGTAVVTGAAGQDGYYLVRRLLGEGLHVHATVRDQSRCPDLLLLKDKGLLDIHELDLDAPGGHAGLIKSVRPREWYNFAGQSSVSASFADPATTWRTNANAVQVMLEAIRVHSPETRFYQSSSTDMFGVAPGRRSIKDETSPLMPESPYAAAKAAAHVMCDAYRRSFGLRVAAGILANHESRRRPEWFLTKKVTDHVRAIRRLSGTALRLAAPLPAGNLAAERDWGFAPDYVEGIVLILRQIDVRSAVAGQPPESDHGANYRDYVLASGRLHAVWQLIDRAFAIGGHPLEWDRSPPDPADWTATLRATGTLAVRVDRHLIRPTDPSRIRADPERARRELGWRPRPGLDRFLQDMLAEDLDVAH